MLNQWEITYKEDKTKTVSQTIDRASHGIASSARSRHRAPSRPGTLRVHHHLTLSCQSSKMRIVPFECLQAVCNPISYFVFPMESRLEENGYVPNYR